MQYQWVEDDFTLPLQLGDSKPESDKEYIMYHGTTRQAPQSILTIGFQQSADGLLGRGVYLSSDPYKATSYPIDHPESDRVVIKVRVKVGKVIFINRRAHPHQKTWHSQGIDTAWVTHGSGMVERGSEEMCVWDPRRIRIIDTIHPRPVIPSPVPHNSGGGAYGNTDTESIMQWIEDDFELPFGVIQLGRSAPEFDKEYVMYHGTTRQAAQAIQTIGFQQSAGGILGRGVYLSRDLKKASRYPINHPESEKVVMRVTVNVGKVITINRHDHPLQKSWSCFGIDTAWVPPEMVEGGLEEMCVWDPRRIRIIGTIQPRQPV